MIYLLGKRLDFPDPNGAEANGLLAYGGDLSPERLLTAYAQGIFPWPHDESDPLLWFSPDPRTVLLPDQVHLSRSLKKVMNKQDFEVRFDTTFREVITACATVRRKGARGTWITGEMIEAYCRLHDLGFAHSVETWEKGILVGGLYGISLGAAFFGESMFTYGNNGSKIALATLLQHLHTWRFHFLDCQMSSELVSRLGAANWDRRHFQHALKNALQIPTRQGKWTDPRK